MVFVKATGPYRFSDSQNFSAGTDLNFTVQGLFPWTKYNISVQAVTVQPGPMSPWTQVETLEDGKSCLVQQFKIAKYQLECKWPPSKFRISFPHNAARQFP